MNENELAQQLHHYLNGYGLYDRRHTASIFGELPERRPHRRGRQVLALVAGLVVLALTATLLLTGHRMAVAPAGRSSPHPSATVTATAEPTLAVGSLPAGDLEAAGLANVAGLVQQVDVASQGGDQTARLVGVYADAVRTVFLIDGVPVQGPGGPFPMYTLYDSGGLFKAGLSSGKTPDGGFVSFAGPLTPGADGIAPVTLNVGEIGPGSSGGPMSPAATWSFAVQVRVVTTVTSPQTPSSLVVGSRTYRVSSLLETPNVVGVVLVVDNAGVADVTGSPPSFVRSPLVLTDPTGANLTPVYMGAHIAGSGAEVTGSWVRGPAGTYRLTVNGPGGAQNSFQFDVS